MKRLVVLISVLSLITLFTVGCANNANAPVNEDSANGETVLKVGATPLPHAEILKHVEPILAEEGIKLEVVEFTDYVTPNRALADGEIHANFFQHIPYLDKQNEEHSLGLTYIAKVHIEPIGIYSDRITTLDSLAEGSTIAISNNPAAIGRALRLLEKAEIIKLKDEVGISGTTLDIVDNPKEVEITELDPASLARVLPDVDIAVINTNYALEADLNPLEDALFIEDSDSPYANILVVKEDDTDNEALKKLAKVLTSEEVREFIEENYGGAIVPAF